MCLMTYGLTHTLTHTHGTRDCERVIYVARRWRRWWCRLIVKCNQTMREGNDLQPRNNYPHTALVLCMCACVCVHPVCLQRARLSAFCAFPLFSFSVCFHLFSRCQRGPCFVGIGTGNPFYLPCTDTRHTVATHYLMYSLMFHMGKQSQPRASALARPPGNESKLKSLLFGVNTLAPPL